MTSAQAILLPSAIARAVEAEAARQRENADAYIKRAVQHRLRVDGAHLKRDDE